MPDTRIEDTLAITRTIQLVARAYDHKRHRELLPTLYVEKARQHYWLLGHFIDFSFPEGIDRLVHYHERCWATQHLVASPTIEFEGSDLARVESPVHAVHVQVHHDGRRTNWLLGGYYLDVMLRQSDGSWVIREREAHVTYESGEFVEDVRLFPTLADYRAPL